MRYSVVPVVAILFAPFACGQTSRGTVTGTVSDPSEAVVTGAAVKLLNTSTGVRRESVTNGAGIYRFER